MRATPKPRTDGQPPGASRKAARTNKERMGSTFPGVCRCGETLQVLSSRLARLERLHLPEFAAETAAVTLPVPPSRLEAIAQVVASHCGVSMADLKSRTRTPHLANARMLAYYVQREATNASLPALAQWWGRDHGSIINGCRQTENRLETIRTFKPFLAGILAALGVEEQQ